MGFLEWEVGVEKLKMLRGLVFMALGVVVFLSVFETLSYSLSADQFALSLNIGRWGTPTEVLWSMALVVSIIFFARVSVSMMDWFESHVWPELQPMNKKTKAFCAVLVFSALYWWLEPAIRWATTGYPVPGISDLWSSFGRAEAFGLFPAAAIIVGFEKIRRKMGGEKGKQ